jgi:lipopolysaccharide export system permease protein
MVLLVNNFVEPWSNRKLYDVLAQAQSDLFSVAVRSGTFMRLEEGLYVQVNEKLPGGELGGIFLADSRTEGNESIYYARSGIVKAVGDTNILFLVDGELQQRNLSNNQISIVTFTSYALDMAAFVPAGGAGVRRPKEQTTLYLLDPPEDDYYVQNAGFVIKQELAQRFSTWMYPLAFGLVAFTFLGKARSNRHEQFQNGAIVAGITLGTRGFGFYSSDEAGSSVVMEILTYAIPAGIIVIFGFLALTGRTLTIPRAWARLTDRLIEYARGKINRWKRQASTEGGSV